MQKKRLTNEFQLFSSRNLWLISLVATLFGSGWLFVTTRMTEPARQLTPVFTNAPVLEGPLLAQMDSRAFQYSPGWQSSQRGADPAEPADPWQEPAGTITFQYRGRDLALALAVGNYWGYLYVTVDGEPANQLPQIAGNLNRQGGTAGYRTFYAPEAQGADGPTPQWILVHRAADPVATHTVQVEVWRSWQQWPIRGVAVDALPLSQWPLSQWPLSQWPSVALLLIAGWSAAMALVQSTSFAAICNRQTTLQRALSTLLRPRWTRAMAPWFALIGLGLVMIALWRELWPLTWVGLALLAWAGLQRPAIWIGALLFGLPFYFSYHLPLLPGRALGIIDVGVLGGLLLTLGHHLLSPPSDQLLLHQDRRQSATGALRIVIALIVSWALLAAVQADQLAVALYEWRTVFGYGALFAMTLHLLYRSAGQQATPGKTVPVAARTSRLFAISDQQLLIGGWLLGGTLVAVIALWHYASDTLLIEAEGVQRVRAFYGSPNNLALYLERTIALTAALALLGRSRRWQWFWLAATLIQGAALILTYSKGALLLGLPAILIVLLFGGALLLKRQNVSRRPLWWLVAMAVVALVLLLPALATERFQQLANFDQGTGFIRLQLWRSSWQMALDHPWFGVGPDNFLYAYRSAYILPAAWQEPNLNHPHNWLLDWWTRLGLPGLLLAFCWFGLLLWRQWQHFWRNTQSVLALGLLAATAAALAHGLIDASYALPDLMLVWVLMSYLPVEQAAAELP